MRAVITVVGKDKTGIISKVSTFLAERFSAACTAFRRVRRAWQRNKYVHTRSARRPFQRNAQNLRNLYVQH